RSVARRLFDALAPGGWLITASSDPPLGGEAPFESVVTTDGVFYRRSLNCGWPQPDAAARSGEVLRSRDSALPASPILSSSLAMNGQRRTEPNLTPSPPHPLTPSPPHSPLTEARDAFAQGNYSRAAELTRPLKDDVAACVLHVKALANIDAVRAE